ncbi:MAG: hypothetical protein ACJ79M_12070 [Myxococcales bacterium]
MKTRSALLLLCGVFAAGARAGTPERPLVVFHGNVLLDEVVYRSALDLPDTARATPVQALEVSAKIRGLLRRAGYDLASVHATVKGDQITVEIDEGHLDKIIVLGEGIMESFRFKLELAMPEGVFNRPILERQLLVLANRYRLRRYSYELVAIQRTDHQSTDEPDPALPVPDLRPGDPYELRIHIATSPWSRGFAPEVSVGSPEGLGAGGQYRNQDVFVRDDRWEVRARAAGASQQLLDSDSSRPVLTRLFAQGRWLSPPIFTDSLRPALTVRGDYLSRQRADLHLDSFRQATFSASFDASVFRPRGMLALGMGIERRFLVSLVKGIGANPLIDGTPRAQTRPYAEAIAEMVFNPGELRTDRKHLLDVEARFYTGSPSSEQAMWLRGAYQHRFPFGWHELWWHARGTLLEGGVLFPDEESVGEHLHGAFGGSDYASKLASTGFEFRYSLRRDTIKLGFFYDQLVFGSTDRKTSAESLQTAGAGGPAVHLLLADEFQIDFYFALGWKPDGSVDHSPSLVVRQVF